jgi:hypothetical protein
MTRTSMPRALISVNASTTSPVCMVANVARVRDAFRDGGGSDMEGVGDGAEQAATMTTLQMAHT